MVHAGSLGKAVAKIRFKVNKAQLVFRDDAPISADFLEIITIYLTQSSKCIHFNLIFFRF